jgi:general secretion pathway protein E
MAPTTQKQTETNAHSAGMRVGDLLLKHTALTKAQLSEALDQQNETGELLGDILIAKNFIQKQDLIKVLCIQTNVPYLDEIKVDDIDPLITTHIPINYAKQHDILPYLETELSVSIVLGNPFKFNTINDVYSLFQKEVKILVAHPSKIQDAINRVYEKASRNIVDSIEDEFEENLDLEGPIDILDAGADEAPVIRFVNSIIFRAVKERASDIHIEPYDRDVVYRFRINGVMTEINRQPKKTHAAVSSRIKVMARLDIAEKRLPQDGRIKLKIAGKDIDIRLSTVPIQSGERIVMRVLEKDNSILELEKLGFGEHVLKHLNDIMQRKHGVLYVSGPTGHGKTTTLFSILDKINSPDKMIITVEDPVEYELPGVSQIQVNPKIELTFARALRSILRQNPDVIMVGETRDYETAEMAINASLTGHFVLSTIHTNDSASTPTRLIDMGVQPFLISSSLIAIIAQRLIRVLCKDCKIPHELTNFDRELLGVDRIPPNATIFQAKGCHRCNYTGYSGRTNVAEILVMSDEIRSLILKSTDSGTIKKMAISQGMVPLRTDATQKIFKGITSIEEVVRAINEDETGS